MIGNGVAHPSAQEHLLARLSEPKTAEALDRLLDRLDVISFGVDAIDGLLRRSEVVADSIADSLKDLKTLADSSPGGENFLQSLPKMAKAGSQMAAVTQTPAFQNLIESGLIETLGDPKTIEAIKLLLGKLELAVFALDAVDGFIRRSDVIADNVGVSLQDLRSIGETFNAEKLKPFVTALPQLLESGTRLADSGLLDHLPQFTDAAVTLANSGLLRPDVVNVMAEVGATVTKSYQDAKKEPERKTSLFGLIGALRDPDIQRSLTLLLDVAKHYGPKTR